MPISQPQGRSSRQVLGPDAQLGNFVQCADDLSDMSSNSTDAQAHFGPGDGKAMEPHGSTSSCSTTMSGGGQRTSLHSIDPNAPDLPVGLVNGKPNGRKSTVSKASAKRRSRWNHHGDWRELDDEREEDIFMQVLDMLEEQDEFTSSASSSSASDSGDSDIHELESDESDASLEDCDESRWEQYRELGQLEGWQLTAAMLDLKQRKLPHQDVCARIIRDVTDLYSKSPTVVHLQRPAYDSRIIVVGDIHGHFGDLMHILDEHGDPRVGPGGTSYLFNGDFVDRGSWGPEVLLLIYCLKLAFPTAVHMNRGNHEDDQQNKQTDNGFSDQHCNRAWRAAGRSMYALCRRSFKMLPLVHVLGNEIAVFHGGLPLDPHVTLEEINAIDRKHRVPVMAVNVLGYPKQQKIRNLITRESDEGEEIEPGQIGKLVKRIGKTNRAQVRFQDGKEASILVHGFPEVEDTFQPCWDSEEDHKKARANRIFVALLWSDPVLSGKNGPSKRGVGTYFDEQVTRDFLDTNGLTCIVRSHEKRAKGFYQEHFCDEKGVLLATVFSASNYPSGAGEPTGNAASVLVVDLPCEKVPLSLPLEVPSWREPYMSQSRWASSSSGLRPSLRGKLASIEAKQNEEHDDDDEEYANAKATHQSSRVRAIQKLRSMIYVARPALLTFWNRCDELCTGFVTNQEWASAMRACVVPDEDFPWEWIAKHITHLDDVGRCHYSSFLGRFENALLRRLAQRWHGGAVMQLAPGVTTAEEAEEAWKSIDRDGNGKLTYLELRPLLRTRKSMTGRQSKRIEFDAAADDDRVYSVLQSLDHDRKGFVDREEFVNAICQANKRKSLVEQALEGESMSMGATATGSRWSMRSSVGFAGLPSESMMGAVSTMPAGQADKKRTSKLLDLELKDAGDIAIAQCWAAAQSALRSLAAARCSMKSVFEVLDSDHDGHIDRDEFKEGLSQLIRDPSLLQGIDQWEPLLWKLVDEDGSGSVSHYELAELLCIRDIVSL